jgi:hypothetical protein
VVVNFLNKSNAADQRVYEILADKFKLFSGVFGASDEVLGSIESGVDFEKRIAEIYLQCRTEAEIQASFDALQNDLGTEIDEQMQIARRNLLENFDEEVHEKLKLNLQESKEYLNRYENLLWRITKFFLQPYAVFDGSDNSFMLTRNPFPDEHIHPGPYRIGKNIEDANTYRVGHPLAQRIIDKCKNQDLPEKELVFDYSHCGKKVSILESLIGKSGWIDVKNLTVSAFDSEDHIILAGHSDDGALLDDEQCRRIFSLDATLRHFKDTISLSAKESLSESIEAQKAIILQGISQRNSGFFENEMGKLEHWADDVKSSLEIELKNLDKEIRFRRTESKRILNLDEKVDAQREIKEMEKKRNVLRQDLFRAQDEVDVKKEDLIGKIEIQLKQQLLMKDLFTVRWQMR